MRSRTTSLTPWPPTNTVEARGPLVGQSLAGYDLQAFLGEGPNGVVYRAEDLLGNRLAVKVMHIELGRREQAEKLREVLESLSFKQPSYFCPLLDAGFGPEGQLFLVTQELKGCDLEAGLRDAGGLAADRTLEIARQICFALEELHAQNCV